MNGTLALTWWGHASATVELGGLRVALDPLLADRLFHLRRYTRTPQPEAARADVVLVSHLHADHLHLPSLRRFPPGTLVVVPSGATALAEQTGLTRVRAAVPGSVLHLEVGTTTLRVEVLAATHDGRRHPWSRHAGPAVGYRVSVAGCAGASFWFPGDTGLREDMAAVAPVDLALVPVGGWGPSLGEQHMGPEQAAEAVRRVGARWAVPVHWGTFWPVGLRRLDATRHHELFTTPGRRFAEALAEPDPERASGTAVPLLARHGERLTL